MFRVEQRILTCRLRVLCLFDANVPFPHIIALPVIIAPVWHLAKLPIFHFIYSRYPWIFVDSTLFFGALAPPNSLVVISNDCICL